MDLSIKVHKFCLVQFSYFFLVTLRSGFSKKFYILICDYLANVILKFKHFLLKTIMDEYDTFIAVR